ncbi:FtsX-like permease family protein [Actinosynnema pretiosum subsp. pretiosum]|uniref:FtsX-like permease family protein n=1 Tax=Actinosynnema pretiosum subsp. pretiosum TaxID=103721 RepID=A0AA45L8U7_9PSEU|nr:ABC-type antimicrobial peptide transporter,permease component [Actinosynnema pretiosum subsp. pretiosum]QUF05456.1 FtsX-like permease family protein [Actinosynnema pretiosum subsp. pretiosum]
MLRTALRSVLERRSRFVLPLIAVVLGVALTSGALLYTGSIRAQVAAALPDPGVEVTAPVPLPEEAVRAATGAEGVATSKVYSYGRVFVVGRDGAVVGPPGAAIGLNREPDEQELVAGAEPSGADQVALEEGTARRAGVGVGDRVELVVAGTVREHTVSGLLKAVSPELAVGGTLTAFDRGAARTLFGDSRIVLTAQPGSTNEALAAALREVLPDDAYVQAVDPGSALSDNDKLATILLVFAGTALFVSIFVVANTFTMLSAARAREHALLRAVGADRSRITRGVLAEALLIGLAATVIGYALGVGVSVLLDALFAVTEVATAPLVLLAPDALLAALAVGLGVPVIAAWVPARRAAAIPPIAALRTGLPPTAKSLRRRNTAGALITAAGAAAVLGGLRHQDLVYLGAPLLVIGLLVLTPLAASGLGAVLRRPLTALVGVRGKLAVENARRNPRRTASTAGPLMVCLAVCAAMTVPAVSLGASSAEEAAANRMAEVTITPITYAELATDLPERLAALPDVRAVTAYTRSYVELDNGDGGVFVAATPSVLADVADVEFTEGELTDAGTGVAVTREQARRQGWELGTTVTGSARGHRFSLPVTAFFEAPEKFDAGIVVPAAALPDLTPYEVLVRADPDRADAVRDRVKSTVDNPTVVVHSQADAVAEAGQQYALFLRILYALLSVSGLIGALAVVNTMTMSVLERTREIGLLRAVGLDRSRVRSLVRIESGVIALLGAGLGLLAGCLVGVVVVRSQTSAVEVVLPWGRLAAFVLITAAIAVLAALLPARRAAALPVLDAVRSDTE